MKKIILSLVAMAMLFAFLSCNSEPTTTESFIRCCDAKQYTEAKGYIDEITQNFDTYSNKDKGNIIKGLGSLVSYTKDPELGDFYVTLYNKVKDDRNVELDKEAASFCEWVENGFTTGYDSGDAAPEVTAAEDAAMNEDSAEVTSESISADPTGNK